MAARTSITHADLAPKPGGVRLGSKTGAVMSILSILCGLLCFVLCLFAEATRSRVIWNDDDSKGKYECVYSSSGKLPLICGSIALVALGVAMVAQHSYILVAMMSKFAPPPFISWDRDPHSSSSPINSLSSQAAFFFISTWICFAVGEIVVVIGVSVESGHLKEWSKARESCLVIRPGVFTAAAVLSLFTVFLGAALYATLLRLQCLCLCHHQHQETLPGPSLPPPPPPPPPPHLSASPFNYAVK